jgi:hypothetical protein
MNASDVLLSMAQQIARVPTQRDATAKFKEYVGKDPFRQSPATLAEYFDLEPSVGKMTQAFGLPGVKEMEMNVVVVFSVVPAATDDIRERTAMVDASMIQSALELGWTLAGLMNCAFTGDAAIDRTKADRWLVTMRFTVLYNEDILVPNGSGGVGPGGPPGGGGNPP